MKYVVVVVHHAVKNDGEKNIQTENILSRYILLAVCLTGSHIFSHTWIASDIV